MICKRCGAPCDDTDRFCRNCGKHFKPAPVPHEKSNTPFISDDADLPAPPPGPLSQKKKWILFCVFGLLLFVSALAVVLFPHFKQTFMSPASFYLESEAKEISKLSSHINGISDTLFVSGARNVDGQFRFEATGNQYDSLRPILEDLHLRAELNTDNQKKSSLSLSASYSDEVFCRLTANLVGEKLSLHFPDLTEGEVATKLSQVLQKSIRGGDQTISAVTGYSQKELTDWFVSFLEPILLNALEESEQTLDFAVVDGNEVSTVTFTLDAKQSAEVFRALSSALRRDTTLPKILSNTVRFLSTGSEFSADFAAEFNLTPEDLKEFPFFSDIEAALPELTGDHFGSLGEFLASHPEAKEIEQFIEDLADSVLTYADSADLAEGFSLTAFYQGTDLIGRTLKRGSQTVLECFRYRRDGDTILDIRFESDEEIYHFSHVDSSTSTIAEHELSLTRRPADAERSADTGEETIFTLSARFEKNGAVAGVATFLGEIRLTHTEGILIFTQEKILDNETRLYFEHQNPGDKTPSAFKVRGQLQYSAKANTSEIQASSSSDFGTPAFDELILSLKRSLQDNDVFEEYFGKGSLKEFLKEEQKRLEEAGELAELPEEIPNDSSLESKEENTPDKKPDQQPNTEENASIQTANKS